MRIAPSSFPVLSAPTRPSEPARRTERERAAMATDVLELGTSSLAKSSEPQTAPANLRAQAGSQLALAGRVAAPLLGLGGLLFPDSCGKIEHMALQLGNVEFSKPLPTETQGGLMGVWGQLFQTMAPDTRFSVVCADAQGAAAVRGLVEQTQIDPARVKVLQAPEQTEMSIWIRDSMLPVRAQDGHSDILIQDRTYWPGPADNQVAPMLVANNSQLSSKAHPALRIDGGNVLSNNRHTIVGSDSLQHTRERLQELAAQDPANLMQLENFYRQQTGHEPDAAMWEALPRLVFQNEFGRSVLSIANSRPQPAFHIDMTTTPIGDHKFLVGDPGLAIARLQALSPQERAEVNRSMALQAGIDSGDDLVGKLIQANAGPEQQANYDATAQELADAGYEIQRMPALMGLRTTWSLPYLTYNNCMMERYGDTNKVYLPQYGCEPLDADARKIYADNGYQVVPLQMGAISKLEGAIRCSSYALERSF